MKAEQIVVRISNTWLFQSPCGEEVMKDGFQPFPNSRADSSFQSPCGEEVMKDARIEHGLTKPIQQGFSPLAGKR